MKKSHISRCSNTRLGTNEMPVNYNINHLELAQDKALNKHIIGKNTSIHENVIKEASANSKQSATQSLVRPKESARKGNNYK